MILINKKVQTLLLVGIAVLLAHNAHAQTRYSKKTAKLMTVWGENLQATDSILPEYPRPQMVREKWMNLNGIWQFQPANSATEALPSGNLSREILVPFPVESALSGIMQHYENLWYRRSFTIPADWKGERVLLHFEAVDYACEVFVNGVSAGTHQGGYDPFYFDITDFLTSVRTQDIAVRVNDPTDNKGYPRGKQTLYPGGIMYTPTSGIWQTVWLEAVPQQAYISDIRMIPDIDAATLKCYTNGIGIRGLNVRFKIYDSGTEVASIDQSYRSDYYTLNIPQPLKLWSPDSPFLYDMKIYILNGTDAIDSISTYFGMRKISRQLVDGYYKMLLNNQFLFQIGPLDQGFWPDGIYTAPSEEAIRFDIEKIKELGFNMIRKHIKVEPQRWYYWCDKLGLLIWQDMPSMNSYIGGGHPVPPLENDAFQRELEAMVKNHWNSPAIVMWILFNEWQGAHDENTLVTQVKNWDSSRLVSVGSGGPDYNFGDIHDWHSYPPPACPSPQGVQALVCGEYGGIGYFVPGHIWGEANTYMVVSSSEQLLATYTQFADMLIDFKSSTGLSAAVYTQTTDVETELNGLMTYDRKVIKGNTDDFYAINQRVINEKRYYTEVVPTSEVTPQVWKYTLSQPLNNWVTPSFNDSSWSTGNGGFGTVGTPGAIVGTVWKTNNIWLRRKFTLPVGAFNKDDTLVLRIHHDEDCEVYINGIQATALTGYTTSYGYYAIIPDAKAALIQGGENTLAIHCLQTAGGQYIDAGISTVKILPTALENVKKKDQFHIYPNPAHDELRIENGELRIENAEIYDSLGRLVMGQKFSNLKSQISNLKSQISINISSLPAGIYFLNLKAGNYQDSQTFIKK